MRPKVLLASTYEEGWALYEQVHDTVLCVICDVRFPRGGVEDAEAGIALLRRIRELKVSDFESIEAMRQFLLETWTAIREEKRRGQVADFDAGRLDAVGGFVRIGGGSLGGKGRGLAFVHELLSRGHLERSVEGVQITVPLEVLIDGQHGEGVILKCTRP